VRENDSRSEANKRKIDEAERSLVGYKELYERLASCDYEYALELLLRLRNGHSLGNLLEYRGKASAPAGRYLQHPANVDERRLKHELLITLVKSTAPLRDIVQFAATLLSSYGRTGLPTLEMYQLFKRRLITIDALAGVVGMSFPTPASSNSLIRKPSHTLSEQDLYEPDVPHEAPKHWVPASPWTMLTASDDTVSELVSLAMTWLNSFWRLIEKDLFLRAMRCKSMDDSEYCSPFLVHAILAIGAVRLIFAIENETSKHLLMLHSNTVRWTKRSLRPVTSSLGASTSTRKLYVCGRWKATIHASLTYRLSSS